MNELQTQYQGKLQVVQLDFDASENRKVIAALGVRMHPTLVFIDADGTPVRTWFGAATVEQLQPIIQQLVGD